MGKQKINLSEPQHSDIISESSEIEPAYLVSHSGNQYSVSISDNFYSKSDGLNSFTPSVKANKKIKKGFLSTNANKAKEDKPNGKRQQTGKGRVGRQVKIWTSGRKRLFLSYFLQSLIKNPTKSYSFTHWKEIKLYTDIEEYINRKEEQYRKEKERIGEKLSPQDNIQKLGMVKQNRGKQAKSYLQRLRKKWGDEQKQKTFLVLVLEQLYQEYVQKQENEQVIELIQRFEEFSRSESELVRHCKQSIGKHDERMNRLDELQREIKRAEVHRKKEGDDTFIEGN